LSRTATWPHLKRPEASLAAKLRRRLGGSQFDQAFSAGSRLTQRQAADIVRRRPDALSRAAGAGPPVPG
jgi:hypothetical protein